MPHTKIEKNTNAAVSKLNSEIIANNNNNNDIDTILNNIKASAIHAQNDALRHGNVLSDTPTQSSVNLANLVANLLANKNDDLTSILIPDEPYIYIRNNNAQHGGNDTNNNLLEVDATVAQVPVQKLIDDDQVNIVTTNNPLSFKNKIVLNAKNLWDKSGDVLESFVNKTGDFFTGAKEKTQQLYSETTSKIKNTFPSHTVDVTPVSQNLSVMTNTNNTNSVYKLNNNSGSVNTNNFNN